MDVVLDPGEGDGTVPAALAEAQQEGSRTFAAQQSLLPLFADEAHDGAADGGKGRVSWERLRARRWGAELLTRRSTGTAGAS